MAGSYHKSLMEASTHKPDARNRQPGNASIPAAPPGLPRTTLKEDRMNSGKLFQYVALSLLILTAAALPASSIVYVKAGGPGPGTSWATALPSINAGVAAAALDPDKTVWVKDDTFTENVVVATTGIQIYGGFLGTELPTDPTPYARTGKTTVHGLVPLTPLFTTQTGTRVDGFILENNTAPTGAGVLVVGTSTIINNDIIRNNTARLGGGIASTGASLTVTETTFNDNEATDTVAPSALGGSIYEVGGSLIVYHCTFTNELAKVTLAAGDNAYGGAIYVLGGTVVNIKRSVFTNCVATGDTILTIYARGGAVYTEGVTASYGANVFVNCAARGTGDTITSRGGAIAFHNPGTISVINNTFYGNEVTPQAGLVSDPDRSYGLGAAISVMGGSSATIRNNIITHSRGTAVVNEGMIVVFNYNLLWHNAGGDTFGISFPTPASTDKNIMEDPQFRRDYTTRALDPLFHITFGSPAREAGLLSGVPSNDIDGELFVTPGDMLPDIGADEFVDSDNDGGADTDDPSPNAIDPGPPSNETDVDLDGIYTPYDNCPLIANPTQVDSNGDGTGDACTPLATGLVPRAYFVDGTAPVGGDGTTWATAFRTIQDAIDAADSHNQVGWTRNYEVWVRGGQTYNENILIWHGVTVYGGWAGTELPTDIPDPHPNRNVVVNQTIINGGALNSVVVIAHLPQDRYLTPALKALYTPLVTVIDGFTITNGDAELGGGVSVYKEFADISSNRIENNTAVLGGGVYFYNTLAVLEDGLGPVPGGVLDGDTTISNNTAVGPLLPLYGGYGGGIYTERGSPVIIYVIITGNTAFFGGGIASRRSNPIIIGTLIGCAAVGGPNTATGTLLDGKGGGVYMDNASDVGFNEVTIVSNIAAGVLGQGGGIYDSSSNFTMKNSIVAFNIAGHLVPALNGGAIFATGTSPVIADPWCYITYSDFFGNSVDQFVGIPDPTSPSPPNSCPETNYAVDPLFVDPSTCDYNLAAGSPLIGAGDPFDDSPNVGAFQIEDPPVTIGQAKKLPNGAVVEVSGVIVTAVFADGFYIEDVGRTCGIKVRKTSAPVSIGQTVTITGVMTSDGISREIMNADLTIFFAAASVKIAPLAVSNRTIGGDAITGAGKGVGLNNIGLLVKTLGKVTSVSASPSPSCMIDDGCRVGVKVFLPTGVALPTVGAFISVVGIAGVDVDQAGARNRAVRIRGASDVCNLQ